MNIKPTRYFDDFCHYYQKAFYLQQRNLIMQASGVDIGPVGDPLMDKISIYDTVQRRYAGFSKVLEDLHGRRLDRYQPTDIQKNWTLEQWLYVHLVHRCTGSGASFARDHGYRNTCMFEIAKCRDISQMTNFFKNWDMEAGKGKSKPIFTSIGNQPPAFPKPKGYNKASTYFFCEFAPRLCKELALALETSDSYGYAGEIRAWTDWVLKWNQLNGLNRYVFVYTAWIMDIADYWPDLMDPATRVYYGNNAIEAMNLLWSGLKGIDSYDAAMNLTCNECQNRIRNQGPNYKDWRAYPYDMEDVACDMIRYIENYIPKNDYGHLDKTQIFNASSIQDHPKGRQRWMLGTDKWIW